MRVAFDCSPLLDPPTGVGRYARELAHSLEASGVDLARFAVALRGRGFPGIRRLRVPARLAQAGWRRLGRPRLEALTGRVDVVHATNFVLPASSAPGVVTVHDLSFYREDTFPGGARLRDLVPWSARRAARVITPTEAVAGEVRERFGLAAEAVAVTHEGVSPVFFGATPLGSAALAELGIGGPFVVAVGTLEPRKNLPRLLSAWEAARRELEGYTLVLAGPKGWGPELPRTEGVTLLGWVGDETLPGLYAAARAFCYVSLYEGFGLPPLEAMAAGAPALVGAYPAAAEVVGDAALVVVPTDVDAIAAGLVALATDESVHRRLRTAGRARASSFTWEQTARRTLSVYSEVVEE